MFNIPPTKNAFSPVITTVNTPSPTWRPCFSISQVGFGFTWIYLDITKISAKRFQVEKFYKTHNGYCINYTIQFYISRFPCWTQFYAIIGNQKRIFASKGLSANIWCRQVLNFSPFDKPIRKGMCSVKQLYNIF